MSATSTDIAYLKIKSNLNVDFIFNLCINQIYHKN